MTQEVQPGEMPEQVTPVDETSTSNDNPDNLAAELEATRAALKKANAEAAKRRKELEAIAEAEQKRKEAEMSEMDKLKAENERAMKELRQLQLNVLKQQIAKKLELPDALALRLQGETEEELLADGEALKATLPKAAKAPEIRATNPGNAQPPTETDEQRRGRLMGKSQDIFNPVWAAQHGGGVRAIKE